MPYEIDETHDPKLESWVESANDQKTEFPIQNLPLVFVMDSTAFRGPAVRIGDSVASLGGIVEAASQTELAKEFTSVGITLEHANAVAEYPSNWKKGMSPAMRKVISRALRTDSPIRSELKESVAKISEDDASVVPLMLPYFESRDGGLTLHDYTDFYASVYHATNVGSMFRPDNPLLPNYKWIPVGYHGRASSVVPSGTPVRRPTGQLSPAEEGGTPGFGPCKMLDYELEMGVIVGRGNELGQPIPIGQAEDHILGMCLLNDWSARDMQKWEYVPLGPFLAKNFATTVSPYIVTMEALAPFRTPAMVRPEGDPKPLPHLFDERDQSQGGLDITLEVFLASKQMRDQKLDPIRLSKGSFRDMYWTIAQMLTHHASGGCNMQPGDLLGSGTISGPTREARGCLLELTWDGDPFAKPAKLVPGTQRTALKLPTGEERKFLADGDEVIIRGYCEREGYRRIGFGECRGIIEPAIG